MPHDHRLNPTGGPVTGLANDERPAWDGFSVHPRSFHDAGDSVIVEARHSGTYKATGKSMNTQVCHVWDVKNGKVTRFHQYLDTAKFQDVMGAR